MMCGVLAATFEHYVEAQLFLEQATSIDPASVVAWTLLGEVEGCTPTPLCLPCELIRLLSFIKYQLVITIYPV